jgi:hypothetical protein
VVQVKLEPGQPEHVGQKQLALQARGIHPVPLEKLRPALDDFVDRHDQRLAGATKTPKDFPQ